MSHHRSIWQAQQGLEGGRTRSLFLRVIVLLQFFVFVVSSIAFAKASAGLPIRILLLFSTLGCVALIYQRALVRSLDAARVSLIFSALIALLGFAVSTINGGSMPDVIESLYRYVLQALLTICLLTTLGLVFGTRVVGLTFVVVVLISVIIAIAQFAGIQVAWAARESLSQFQDETATQTWLVFITRQDRAMGISLTPIHLSYQLSVGYIIIKILNFSGKLSTRATLIMTATFLAGAVASGNRSAFLSLILSELLFLLILRTRVFFTALPFFAIVGALAVMSSSWSGLRVLTMADGSALGRIPLAVLGWTLVLDNPFGYGWSFDTRSMAHLYWHLVRSFENAGQTEQFGLHSYYLNFLVTYGVTILPLIIMRCLLRRRETACFIVIFVSYFINSASHNSGPYIGDGFFWFAHSLYILHGKELEYMMFQRPGGRWPAVKKARARIRTRIRPIPVMPMPKIG